MAKHWATEMAALDGVDPLVYKSISQSKWLIGTSLSRVPVNFWGEAREQLNER
jgi:hypothetical protein